MRIQETVPERWNESGQDFTRATAEPRGTHPLLLGLHHNAIARAELRTVIHYISLHFMLIYFS